MQQLPSRFITAGVLALFCSVTAQALTIDGDYDEITEWASPTSSVRFFGSAVSLSGNEAVILAPQRLGSSSLGVASVFRRDTSGLWSAEIGLADPETSLSDSTCNRVAINDDVVAIGAPHQTVGLHPGQGAVSIRTRTSTGWASAVITQPDGATGDNFGCSLAFHENLLAIGAPRVNSSGAVYLYERVGNTWNYFTKLASTDAASGDLFGAAVSFAHDSGILAVGAPGKNSAVGAAYVFTLRVRTWTQQAKLTSTDGKTNDLLGSSVSASGQSVAVGAPADAAATGAAYIFENSGSAWAQNAKIVADVPITAGYFGSSVALSTNLLAVGKYGNDAAHIYTGNVAATWSRQASIGSDGRGAFGYAVALSDGNLLIGAPNEGSSAGGKAYLFQSDVIFADGFGER